MTSDEFLGRLSVQGVEPGYFTGICHPAWPGRAFGGQLAAQSLSAAAATLSGDSLQPWSLNTYFHAPTRANAPVDYRVTALRVGRSVATMHVRVEQDDSLRATAIAMFGAPAAGPAHQFERPQTLSPADVTPVDRLLHPSIVPPDADHVALGYPAESLIDMRIPDAGDEGANEFGPRTWMRVLAAVPDEPVTVAAALCYLSDITLGTTALHAHGGRDASSGLQLGALELSLWFTGDADLSQWTLFSQDSAFAGSGHALAHGIFYNSDGEVAAVAMQNALMREAAR